jgi:hypothetical protein
MKMSMCMNHPFSKCNLKLWKWAWDCDVVIFGNQINYGASILFWIQSELIRSFQICYFYLILFNELLNLHITHAIPSYSNPKEFVLKYPSQITPLQYTPQWSYSISMFPSHITPSISPLPHEQFLRTIPERIVSNSEIGSVIYQPRFQPCANKNINWMASLF